MTARSDLFEGVQPFAQRAGTGPAEVVRCLEAQPEFGARSEAGQEQQSCFRGDAPLASNDFVHALKRDTELTRKLELGGTKRSQELLKKNLTRVRRNTIASRQNGES